eukprot:TRINITY_DN12157_c0_g1_i2.p1 TRINITY_DN12157_c0_g1~~TRINITY_DN12157_c0_g1_i2.p1  ORF type:complete len:496 (+),score=125.17 TRINITY_DN12157_c0_g1_i2:37-1524(+)
MEQWGEGSGSACRANLPQRELKQIVYPKKFTVLKHENELPGLVGEGKEHQQQQQLVKSPPPPAPAPPPPIPYPPPRKKHKELVTPSPRWRHRDFNRSYDTWPASGFSQTARLASSQPHLLKEIEAFLDTELSLLHCGKENSTEPVQVQEGIWQEEPEEVNTTVARVFLAAFRQFIYSSKIYGPVLEAVYRRIEMVVDLFEKLHRSTAEMKHNEEVMQQACDERISIMEEQHKKDLNEGIHTLEELRSVIADKDAEILEAKTKFYDLKLIEKMYSDRVNEEHDKVLTMVNQIRDAEEQHQETMIQFEKLKRDTMGVQDLMKLYQKTADELQQIKEDFSDSVPLKQYEALQRVHKEKSEKVMQMKLSSASHRKKIEYLEKQSKKQTQMIEHLEDDCRRLRDGKGRDTPRPDWETIVQGANMPIEDGLSSGTIGRNLVAMITTEKEAVATLEKEIAGMKEKMKFLGENDAPDEDKPADVEYFVGMGTGKDVPKYLRYV